MDIYYCMEFDIFWSYTFIFTGLFKMFIMIESVDHILIQLFDQHLLIILLVSS